MSKSGLEISNSIQTSQKQKAKMYQEFADFEEQLHQFDAEINDMINKKDDNKKKPSPSSSDSDPK